MLIFKKIMFIFKNINKNIGLRFLIINLLSILFFSIIYYIEDKLHINEKSFFDYFYFSLVTQTTVGYNNNNAIREDGYMKIISTIQLISILCILSLH